LPAETSRPSRNNKRTSKRYEAIFDGYNNLGTYSQAFDEMFDGQGNVRGPYKGIFAELSPSDASDLEARAEALGRAFTDQHGRYRFNTVMPGAYVVQNGVPRCPHINLMMLGSGIMRRLVTTVFFAERPESVSDPVLECVEDVITRPRLFAVRDTTFDAEGVQAFRFDIVLRGECETPFFLD